MLEEEKFPVTLGVHGELFMPGGMCAHKAGQRLCSWLVVFGRRYRIKSKYRLVWRTFGIRICLKSKTHLEKRPRSSPLVERKGLSTTYALAAAVVPLAD